MAASRISIPAYFPFGSERVRSMISRSAATLREKPTERSPIVGGKNCLASPTRLSHENVTRGTRSREESTTSETLRDIRIVGSQRDIEAVPCGARRGATALSSRAFTGVIIIVIWRLLFFRCLGLMDGSVITRFSTFVSVDNESQ